MIKLTLATAGDIKKVTQNGNYLEIEIDPKNMDLWADYVNLWLENSQGKMTDARKFEISKAGKMKNLKK